MPYLSIHHPLFLHPRYQSSRSTTTVVAPRGFVSLHELLGPSITTMARPIVLYKVRLNARAILSNSWFPLKVVSRSHWDTSFKKRLSYLSIFILLFLSPLRLSFVDFQHCHLLLNYSNHHFILLRYIPAIRIVKCIFSISAFGFCMDRSCTMNIRCKHTHRACTTWLGLLEYSVLMQIQSLLHLILSGAFQIFNRPTNVRAETCESFESVTRDLERGVMPVARSGLRPHHIQSATVCTKTFGMSTRAEHKTIYPPRVTPCDKVVRITSALILCRCTRIFLQNSYTYWDHMTLHLIVIRFRSDNIL